MVTIFASGLELCSVVFRNEPAKSKSLSCFRENARLDRL